MDAYQIPCLLDDQPGSRICQLENSGIGLDFFFPNITSEPISNLLWQEHDLGSPAAFGVSDDGLSVFNIHGPEFQDLADTHSAACHQFEHQPVPWILGPENDFIDHILFQDLELGWLRSPEKFAQGWMVTRILAMVIEGVFHKIEKCREEGEPQFLGVLFGAVRDR